jgi:hypothetical protein
MAYTGPASGGPQGDLSGLRAEGREPGGRRKKLAGYLKAANEMRASYFQQPEGHSREGSEQDQDSAFPDAAVVRRGNEEMILFPSYARRHIKRKVSRSTGARERGRYS